MNLLTQPFSAAQMPKVPHGTRGSSHLEFENVRRLGSGDVPTLADHGVRDEHPADVKVLAEPSGAERSAQFVRPTLRFVALIRVDSLEGAAVELGVADVVAAESESADRDAAVDGTLVDRGTGDSPDATVTFGVEDADRVDCARHFPRNRLTASRPAWGASSATIESGSMDAALGPAISSVSTGMFRLIRASAMGPSS